jgi:Negative regulator of sigma F
MKPLPPSLRDKILQQAEGTSADTREAASKKHARALVLGLGLSFGLWLAIGGIERGARTNAYFGSVYVPFVATTFLGMCASFMKARRTEEGSTSSLWLLAALAFAGLPFGLLASALLGTSAGIESGDRSDLRCGLIGAGLSAPVAVGLLYAKRHALRIRLATAVVPVASASVFGALLIALRCTCVEVTHMLLGHFVPGLTLAILLLVILAKSTTELVERAQSNKLS